MTGRPRPMRFNPLVGAWDVCPAKVVVTRYETIVVTVIDKVAVTDGPNGTSVLQGVVDTEQPTSEKIIKYCVRAEGHTWSTQRIWSKKDYTATELKTRSKVTALIIAGRLVEKLRAVKIKDMVDIENAVFDLIEDLGGGTEKYPDEVDLDELIRNQRDAIHKSRPRGAEDR